MVIAQNNKLIVSKSVTGSRLTTKEIRDEGTLYNTEGVDRIRGGRMYQRTVDTAESCRASTVTQIICSLPPHIEISDRHPRRANTRS